MAKILLQNIEKIKEIWHLFVMYIIRQVIIHTFILHLKMMFNFIKNQKSSHDKMLIDNQGNWLGVL